MGGKGESLPILKMDGFIANNPNRNHFLHSNMTERGAYLTHPATNGNIKERFATNTRVDQVIFPPWPVDATIVGGHYFQPFEWKATWTHSPGPKKVTAEKSPGIVLFVSIFLGAYDIPKCFSYQDHSAFSLRVGGWHLPVVFSGPHDQTKRCSYCWWLKSPTTTWDVKRYKWWEKLSINLVQDFWSINSKMPL